MFTRAWKRSVAVLVGLLALLLTAAGGLWLAPDGWVVRAVLAHVERTTGLHVRADNVMVDWRASPMAITAGPVEVRGVDEDVLAAARALHATVDLRGILAGRVVLGEVAIVEPRVTLQIVDGAVAGVRRPLRAKRVSSPLLRVIVREARVVGGALSLVFPPQPHSDGLDEGVIHRPLTVTFAGMNIDARPDGAGAEALSVSVKRFEARRGDDVMYATSPQSPPISAALWTGGASLLDVDRVTIPALRLYDEDARGDRTADILIDGVLQVPPARRPGAVDLDVDAAFDLAPLGALLDLPQQFAGRLLWDARTTASTTAFVTEGEVAVRDLFVDRMSLGDVGGHVHVEGEDALVRDGAWLLAGATVHGSARAALTGKVPFHLDVDDDDGLSLYELFRALHFSAAPWIEGEVRGSVAADGALIPFSMTGHGSGIIAGVAVADRDVKRAPAAHKIVSFPRRAHADVTFHADQTSTALSGAVDDGVTRVDGKATLFVNAARGFVVDLAAPSASLASVGEHVGPFELKGAGGGVLHIAGPYAHPRTTAKVHVNDVVLDGFALGDGFGRIDATTHSLALSEVVMRKGDSHYQADVAVDFAAKPMRLQVDVALAGADAEDLRAIIPEDATDVGLVALRSLMLQGPLEGSLHAAGPLPDGSTKRLAGTARLSAGAGAKLLGADVEGHALHLQLERGRLHVDGFK